MSAAPLAFDASGTRTGYGAIDIVAAGQAPTDERFRENVGIATQERRGTTLEDYIAKMDRAGIERSLLAALRCGDQHVRGSTAVPYEAVADACRKYPHRFSGLAGFDLAWQVQEVAHKYFAGQKQGPWRQSVTAFNPLSLDWIGLEYGDSAEAWVSGTAPAAYVARLLASPDGTAQPA